MRIGDVSAAAGEGRLHTLGFSGEISLGRWPREAPHVIAEVTLLNDGAEAWPPGVALARLPGALNGTSGLSEASACAPREFWHTADAALLSPSCRGEVPPQELVTIILTVELPPSLGRPALGLTTGSGRGSVSGGGGPA